MRKWVCCFLICMLAFVSLANAQYAGSPPMPDKYLMPDGSIQSFSGVVYAPADVKRANIYKQSSWNVAKWLLPDGSIASALPFSGGSSASITDTIFDAAGDLIQGSGANAGERLAVGTAYQVLHSNGTKAAWTSTLGATGTRLTDAYFTALYGTGITTGIASTTAGTLVFLNATNANAFTITSGVSGAAIGWTLPTAAPGGANYLLNVDADGTMGYTDPAGFQTAITFGTGTETALASAPDASGGLLSVGGLGSVTQAYSAILDGLAGVTPANNGIFGYNNSGTLGLYTNHSHDDSAAQFYSATASKGTVKHLLSGSTDGKLLTVAWNHTDDKTLNFPDPTTGDSVTYGSAAIRLDTGGATARVKTISDTADTIVELTQTQTLTNKTLTAPYATLARVDGHAAISPLSAAQVSGTVIRNTGQALADVNHTLPQAAAGYNFIAYVGTTLAATNYWRFTADASPQDYMCLDGTCGKTYVSVDTPTMGDTLTCYTEQMSGTGIKNEADLGIGTSANTSVKNTVAVEFDIAGTGYSKAIAETAPGNDTIPQNKYGAVAFDIGANGTIDAIEASANATGYDSAALAIAGIPAVEAAHTRLGTVTAISTEAGGFVFGTTALNAANTTVAYTDATVYTPSFGWVCITGKGTWSTD